MNPFKMLESLILGPPRLALRTLDDIHNLVEVGSDMNRRLGHIERATGDIVRQLDLLLEIARLLERSGETIVAAAKRVDSMAREIIALGDRIETAPEAFKDVNARFEELAGQIAEEGKVLQDRAVEMAERGAEMAAAIPFLRDAMELASPLEGAVKSLGQIVESATGGRSPKPRSRSTRASSSGSSGPSGSGRSASSGAGKSGSSGAGKPGSSGAKAKSDADEG